VNYCLWIWKVVWNHLKVSWSCPQSNRLFSEAPVFDSHVFHFYKYKTCKSQRKISLAFAVSRPVMCKTVEVRSKRKCEDKKKKKLSEEKNPHSYIWQTLDCIPHWSAGFIPGKEIHTGHCHQLLARVNPDLDWFLYYPTENKVYSKLIALFELS